MGLTDLFDLDVDPSHCLSGCQWLLIPVRCNRFSFNLKHQTFLWEVLEVYRIGRHACRCVCWRSCRGDTSFDPCHFPVTPLCQLQQVVPVSAPTHWKIRHTWKKWKPSTTFVCDWISWYYIIILYQFFMDKLQGDRGFVLTPARWAARCHQGEKSHQRVRGWQVVQESQEITWDIIIDTCGKAAFHKTTRVWILYVGMFLPPGSFQHLFLARAFSTTYFPLKAWAHEIQHAATFPLVFDTP